MKNQWEFYEVWQTDKMVVNDGSDCNQWQPGRKPNEQLFHWLRLRLWPQMMMKRLVFEELIWQMGSCWQPLTLKDEERFPIRDLFHRNLCSSWTKAYILTSWITDPVKIDKHFTSANSRSVFPKRGTFLRYFSLASFITVQSGYFLETAMSLHPASVETLLWRRITASEQRSPTSLRILLRKSLPWRRLILIWVGSTLLSI